MLKNLSIVLVLIGLISLVALVCLVGVHKPPAHIPAWWVIASTWSMAFGMVGLAISTSRQWRTENQKVSRA